MIAHKFHRVEHRVEVVHDFAAYRGLGLSGFGGV